MGEVTRCADRSNTVRRCSLGCYIPVNVTLMENAAYFHKVESPVVELVLPEPNSTLSGTQPLTGRRSPLRPAVSPLIWTAMIPDMRAAWEPQVPASGTATGPSEPPNQPL